MLSVNNIKKTFAKTEVIKGVSFSVKKGESFGLLGPNGAGKSTIISMICGLLPFDSGEIIVHNLPIDKHALEVKQKIGIVPQEIALYPTLSGRENLIFWGKMYGLSHSQAKKRAEEVLEIIELSDRAKEKIETYSGGMKRRINIGAALMHKPELLIMDEPTVGIDPQSRNHILETVKQLNLQGMTVIYTSHYMEEVDYLCDRIGIVDQGKMIALGSKNELCNRIAGGTPVKISLDILNDRFLDCVKELPSIENVQVDLETTSIDVIVNNQQQAMGQVFACANENGVNVTAFAVNELNLESVFLQLTGRSLRD